MCALAAAEPPVFRVRASPTSLLFPLPSYLLDGRDFSRASWSPRDTDGLERRAVLSVAAGSCDWCLQDLDFLEGVRGGELGGSESGLGGAIALGPSFGVGRECEAENVGGVGQE